MNKHCEKCDVFKRGSSPYACNHCPCHKPIYSTNRHEETHSACLKRIREEGGKARCCYCVPHKDCEINSTPKTPYNQRDHSHCWESKEPPCGLKGTHRCCLCELPAPKVSDCLIELGVNELGENTQNIQGHKFNGNRCKNCNLSVSDKWIKKNITDKVVISLDVKSGEVEYYPDKVSGWESEKVEQYKFVMEKLFNLSSQPKGNLEQWVEDYRDTLQSATQRGREIEKAEWETKTIVVPNGSTHPVHDRCDDCFQAGVKLKEALEIVESALDEWDKKDEEWSMVKIIKVIIAILIIPILLPMYYPSLFFYELKYGKVSKEIRKKVLKNVLMPWTDKEI